MDGGLRRWRPVTAAGFEHADGAEDRFAIYVWRAAARGRITTALNSNPANLVFDTSYYYSPFGVRLEP